MKLQGKQNLYAKIMLCQQLTSYKPQVQATFCISLLSEIKPRSKDFRVRQGSMDLFFLLLPLSTSINPGFGLGGQATTRELERDLWIKETM